MPANPPVLLIDGNADRAAQLEDQLRRRGHAATRVNLATAEPTQLSQDNLAVLVLDTAPAADRAPQLAALLEHLVQRHVATLVWGTRTGPTESGPLVEWLAATVSLDEVVAKIETLAHYVPLIRGFERELQNIHRLGEQLNNYFNEIDQEMRLAGRLQRDFLPRQLLNLPPYSFHAVYRPASWVSGDMYDVFRIDEHHVGMFVADAMGHGVAAGLLTMFLRQALVVKRVDGSAYSIISPSEALHNLNECLVRQKLPNCQFVTAAYAVLDTRCGELQLARAGHPYPLLIGPGGQVREVRTDGSLLGLADLPADFEQTRLQLAPGHKLVFYTDGIEDVVLMPRREANETTVFTPQLHDWARLPSADMVRSVEEFLDCREGSLHPADDVTLLTLEATHPGTEPHHAEQNAERQ